MVRAGIVGATGYGGRELVRLLCAHPRARLVAAASTSAAGQPLTDVVPGFGKLTDVVLETFDAAALAKQCDVVFIGAPGTESMPIAAALREAGARVIDIGPDFRLKDPAVWKATYKVDHTAPGLLQEAVYGLVPSNRAAIKKANLVAGPGCYPISALVPLQPLVPLAEPSVPVVIDSVSGVSGAGRGMKQHFHFPEMNENVWAYGLTNHRHVPEMEQELGGAIKVQFNPHVGPYTRGIVSTITIRPSADVDLEKCYARYADEPFVRVLGEGKFPDAAGVRATNFVDLGWIHDTRTGNLIVVSAVDNLMGGTAGMAVQCMNLMFGLGETDGLLYGGMSV